MVKPEWGLKRHCQSCGVNFYDLNRDPIICPACQAEFNPEAGFKPRRSRVAAAEEEEKPVIASEPVSEVVEVVADSDVGDAGIVDAEIVDAEIGDAGIVDAGIGDAGDSIEAEEEDESLITDASELGGDEDDVSEVVGNMVADEEKA